MNDLSIIGKKNHLIDGPKVFKSLDFYTQPFSGMEIPMNSLDHRWDTLFYCDLT